MSSCKILYVCQEITPYLAENDMSTLCRTLSQSMQERGITKYTLHKEYHFSKSLIHRLQNNEGVSMNTINTLCNILDCKIEDIATHYKD